MSRRPIARPVLALVSLITLLVAPTFAGHHEAGEASPAATERAETPAEEFKRLTDVKGTNETAPDVFKVELDTTKGRVLLEVHRDWSPNGADRFYNLVKLGYYTDIAFFRVIDGFMVQFGMHGKPRINKAWNTRPILDDPVKQSNERGFVSFAKTNRPNSRTTQLFINLVDNEALDGARFAPFARVIEGMDVVDAIHVTGEGGPRGPGPSQQRIKIRGNAYLQERFPEIDYLKSAHIVD